MSTKLNPPPLRITASVSAAVAALASASALASTAIGAGGTTTVFLASNDAHDMSRAHCVAQGGCGAVVQAPVVLQAGARYEIKVSGTVSAWNFSHYRCGHALSGPQYPTEGGSTPTTDDAQFRFASPGIGGCGRLPVKTGLFQIDLGDGWFHPIANGDPTRPSGDPRHVQHPYTFTVTGLGSAPKFRYVDYHPSDNSGEFKVVVVAGP